ncbi:ATP-binding cassette domain-containing protein [Gordonia soli]|uniref:Putative peptide ABC transporter ATP-binding protein n=1 Tax=Gordonia soli NBRC 108243 TaxID=1223545 RepID=M0QQC7_9ACTN|nr:ABC transporter ATP-binding protein [Gordonia soli]GAC70446.1 putative peptide ABC transporter ATP-binding protein [Gordonia soli NBRC 108243]
MTDRARVLDITDLVIRTGDRTLVDGLSVHVDAGEIVALVGESGSGKSLTGRAALGLVPDTLTTTGSVVVADRQIVGASAAELRGLRGTAVSMVFQEPQSALNPSQRVGRQIREVLRAHRRVSRAEARATAIDLLETVGIPEPRTRVDWYPHQLSGGQKQRVVIALALAGDPGLLIADEPTTALDATVSAAVLDLFEQLRTERDLGILLITHDMGVVAERADRVVVVRNGEFIEEATVADLFAHPTHEYTRELLAAVPTPSPSSTNVPGDDTLVSVRDLTVRYPAAAGAPAFTALRSIDLEVARGEVLGVVGESGSGKTTFGRALVGLAPVVSGSVDRRTDRLAMVHQDPFASLDPRWTVARSVAEPLVVSGEVRGREARTRVLELLDAVRLPAELADRLPRHLSGGQRQRVALARALAARPDLVVADEPTSALDVSVQADVLQLFTDLQRELGFAAVFITHDLAVVGQVADRIAVFREGRLVEWDTAATVFDTPRADYTRELLAAVPIAIPREAR